MEYCKFCKMPLWKDGEFCTEICKHLYCLTIEHHEFIKEKDAEREEEAAPG